MHKGVVLIVEAEDREEALSGARDFLSDYQDQVWDWYQIGGRWAGLLNPVDEEYRELSKRILRAYQAEQGKQSANDYIYRDTIKACMPELDKLWKQMKCTGPNPWDDHYTMPEDGGDYDVLPLSECRKQVKDYCGDLKQRAQHYFDELLKRKAEEDASPGSYSSSGYYARRYADAAYGEFCFDVNVYDVSSGRPEHIPEEMDGRWAVVVDMHN